MPISFVYCTIYQQDIWREGDDKLIAEQKKTWRNFFNLVDNVYNVTLVKLGLKQQEQQRPSLSSKFDSLDLKNLWNLKVQEGFVTIDQVVSNPKMIACKVYRKIQPYVSTTNNKTITKDKQTEEKTDA